MLSPEEIAANAETYKRQVFRILDPERTKVCFNGDWLLPLTAADMVRLASKMTVARMLEREDFKLRYRQGQPIGVHELLYPLAQGYDSVALEADIELGGSDQLFNLLVGRELQRDHGQAPQIVMTLPLLEGTDAHEEDGKITGAKMSKSLGNYVGIEEPAPQQYGKLMSVSDGLMWRYYELLSARSTKELEALRASVATGRVHPMQAKRDLAHELVSRFRSPAEADAAAEDFRVRFSKREIPQDLPEVELEVGSEGLPLFQLLREAGLSQSGKEARRSCAQGAVKVDGEKVTDPTAVLEPGPPRVVQVGKRKMARVTLR